MGGYNIHVTGYRLSIINCGIIQESSWVNEMKKMKVHLSGQMKYCDVCVCACVLARVCMFVGLSINIFLHTCKTWSTWLI